ncbi:unnamed protein product [Litomosoides sigmodontis]|uniref:Matrix-remodeling-associated protein 7 helical domain-containing protein n=1 Tax=Litomosoides sigmodontis TaxID=42156 RepID=A0A3P6T1N0_LITSI|nr:unnamed protein product [Litomosoides sigmodontis]
MDQTVMQTFEDYDDGLCDAADTTLQSLPPHNYANSLQEYPALRIIMTALCALVLSVCFWVLLRMRRQEGYLDNIALSDRRFSSSVMSKVQQRITNKHSDTTLLSSCDKESFKFEAYENSHNGESNELDTSFNELYGKLATVNLRTKAKKLEEAMTEKERKEEQLIQQKQLESICAMVMQEPEKFGLYDKSEIAEQMKLYSL